MSGMTAEELGKLSDNQLGALKMVGGDLAKLPDGVLLGIQQTLKAEPSLVGKAASAVNTGVNWLGTQLIKGATGLAGVPGAVDDMANYGMARLMGQPVENAQKYAGGQPRVIPRAEDMNNLIFNKMGVPEVNAGDNPALTLHKPFGLDATVNVGKILDAAPQALPAMVMGGGAIPSMLGGMVSEGAGQAAAGTPYEIPARLAGGLAGYKAGQRVATPLPSSLAPEEARLVEIAKEKGIPLTVGQETGRGRAVESALSRFPTSQGRMAEFADTQNVGVNKAALAEAGATGDRLDPTTMNGVIKNASNDFEAAKNASGNVKLDTNFYRDLNKTITGYLDNTPAGAQVPAVTKRATDFVNVPGRELTGQQYQEFRRTLNDAASSVTDVGASRALQGMRNALDDAMQASLPADQAAAWKEVRKNWANLKILTKATAGGSVDSRAAGNLSPSALSLALRSRQGADRFASTEGGLNDVARMAGYLADTRPNSGTPSTLAMQSMFAGGPIGVGAMTGGVPGAMAGAGVAALPNLAARAMTGSQGFGWLRDYLANQSEVPRLGMKGVPFGLLPSIPRLENRQ